MLAVLWKGVACVGSIIFRLFGWLILIEALWGLYRCDVCHSNVTDIDTKKEHVFPQKVDTRNKKKNGHKSSQKKERTQKFPKKSPEWLQFVGKIRMYFIRASTRVNFLWKCMCLCPLFKETFVSTFLRTHTCFHFPKSCQFFVDFFLSTSTSLLWFVRVYPKKNRVVVPLQLGYVFP